MATEEESQDTVDILGCQQCKFPIVLKEDVLMDSAEVVADRVYQYDLDVLDETIPVLSCQDSRRRYDVVRVKPNKWVNVQGEPATPSIWLVDRVYTSLTCLNCTAHLGWGIAKAQCGAHPDTEVTVAGTGTSERNDAEYEKTRSKEEGVEGDVAADSTLQAQSTTTGTAGRVSELATAEVPDVDDDNFTGPRVVKHPSDVLLDNLECFCLIITKLSPLKRDRKTIDDLRKELLEQVPAFNPVIMFSSVINVVQTIRSAIARNANGDEARIPDTGS
ncbi:hypothetical protein DIPPA_01190 [Diplonema papillatum]|nr:hypothetical protein DIPPA_01190 [Diplonema papillatum]